MHEIASLLVTGLITLAAAFGGAFLQHRTQRQRDLDDYNRKRADLADDVDRAALREMIRACGELHEAIVVLGTKSSRFPPHPQFPGVAIPLDDLICFKTAESHYVAAYSTLKSDQLTEKASKALRAANDLLISIATSELNELNTPTTNALAMNGAVAAWARLLYYGREREINWENPPIRMTPMSNHPLEAALRNGELRARRPKVGEQSP